MVLFFEVKRGRPQPPRDGRPGAEAVYRSQHPALMKTIAILHHRRAPDEPRYLEIFLRNRQTSLGEQRTLKVIDLASWVVENPQDPQNWSGRR